MKLILHNDSDEIIEVIEDIRRVEVDGASIYWTDGSITDIKVGFTLLSDSDNFDGSIGDTITSETKALDKSAENAIVDIEKEVEEVKKENDNLKEQINKMNAQQPVNLM